MAQLLRFPHEPDVPSDRDLAEIIAAINLVARGAARIVRLVNLAHPMRVVGSGAARASTLGVRFQVQRRDGTIEVIVGPRR